MRDAVGAVGLPGSGGAVTGIDPRALAGARVEHRDGVNRHRGAVEGQGPEATVAANEIRHEVVGGRAQKFFRGGVLGQLAAAGEHGHAVTQGDGLVDVVGDEHDGAVQSLLQVQEFALQVLTHHGVHCGEGFIHEQDGRIGRERSGHAHALLLSAGQLRRVAGGQRLVQAHGAEKLASVGACRGLGHPVQPGDGGDVVLHRAVGHEPGLLHHVAHGTAQLRGGNVRHVTAVNLHRAGGGFHHAVEHAQRSGFAAAGGAHEHGE